MSTKISYKEVTKETFERIKKESNNVDWRDFVEVKGKYYINKNRDGKSI